MVAKTPIRRMQTVKRGDAEAWGSYEAGIAMAEEDRVRGSNDALFVQESIGAMALEGSSDYGMKLVRDPEQPQGFTRVYRLTGPNKGESFDYPTLWLRHLLPQRHPATNASDPDAGKLAYTVRKDLAPKRTHGTQVCFLHPSFKDAETIQFLGIATQCFKSNLPPGRMGLQGHCAVKHKAEWAAYQDYLKEAREDAQRATDAAFRETVASVVKGKE